jgi:monoamine oxidase
MSNRRDFLKIVIAGSIAAGCPIDLSALSSSAAAGPVVDGEHNEICHKVRDGVHFRIPPVSARRDLVIVGGGISGLAAAHFLPQKYDWLLLEKEPHFGGNAYAMDYKGVEYATGAAFLLDEKDEAAQLARELGMELLPIKGWDGSIIDHKFIPDMWGDNLDQLPYSASVIESFKKFKKEMLAIDVKKREHELDNTPFTKFLAGYGPELHAWWDCYGPSNWGARAASSSALVAIDDFQDFAGDDRTNTHNTWPGGNGALTKKLVELMLPKYSDRMLREATIVAVTQEKNEAHVTYMHGGKLTTVAAKGVIMATPKFITRYIVTNLPDAQNHAMRDMRYCPYPVVNLIFDRPVFQKAAYDNWCPGNRFTDFIPADFTVRGMSQYESKYSIMTFYTPLHEEERSLMLTDAGCEKIARDVVRDFKKLLPDTDVDPIEAHIYRRGHPMFEANPGTFTRLIPAAKKPMRNIFFANTDSEGPESLTAGGIAAAKRCIAEFEQRVAGTTAPHRSVFA